MNKPALLVLNPILCIFGLCFWLISLFVFYVWIYLRPISCSFYLLLCLLLAQCVM